MPHRIIHFINILGAMVLIVENEFLKPHFVVLPITKNEIIITIMYLEITDWLIWSVLDLWR